MSMQKETECSSFHGTLTFLVTAPKCRLAVVRIRDGWVPNVGEGSLATRCACRTTTDKVSIAEKEASCLAFVARYGARVCSKQGRCNNGGDIFEHQATKLSQANLYYLFVMFARAPKRFLATASRATCPSVSYGSNLGKLVSLALAVEPKVTEADSYREALPWDWPGTFSVALALSRSEHVADWGRGLKSTTNLAQC